MTPDGEAYQLLRDGALTVHGRLTGASNAVLYASVTDGGRALRCVYKPIAGEQPLWDFPHGTLAEREVAAHEVCQALGWDFVPPTLLRDGPHGPGMCQQWIGPAPGGTRPDRAPLTEPDTAVEEPGTTGEEPDAADAADEPVAAIEELLALVDRAEPETGWKAVGRAQTAPGRTALLVHADDPRLRRLAVFDAVINNADRKGGHLLIPPGGRLYAIDHGVSLHTEDKLRTLLWGWAGEKLPEDAVQALHRLATELNEEGPLVTRLEALITRAELAALRERTAELLRTGCHPLPGGGWPAIPWPLV